MPENGLLSASTPSIRQAVQLLDDVVDALVDPAHRCKDAWASNREGERIDGPILEVVAGDAASRCMLGELLHQGLLRGFRIEIATAEHGVGQVSIEITRAPASLMVAARALDRVAWSLNEEHARRTDELLARYPSPEADQPGRVVLWLTSWNDTASHAEVLSCVTRAVEMLRAELDRRAKGRAR
jgi:hypothetical protein